MLSGLRSLWTQPIEWNCSISVSSWMPTWHTVWSENLSLYYLKWCLSVWPNFVITRPGFSIKIPFSISTGKCSNFRLLSIVRTLHSILFISLSPFCFSIIGFWVCLSTPAYIFPNYPPASFSWIWNLLIFLSILTCFFNFLFNFSTFSQIYLFYLIKSIKLRNFLY